jgi:N-acetylglucosaminyldiphosphoundecaprenol N-acetyl-beta-D-mannosaminyltransferase
MGPSEIPRANVLGVGVSAIDLDAAVDAFREALGAGRRSYVCVTSVHGVMEARRDATLRRVLNESLLSTPDGMPTVWVGRLQGFPSMRRVCGPDLMRAVCAASAREGYSHFFYGGKPGVAERLSAVLIEKFPGLRVVGTYCPPFGPLGDREESELSELVAMAKPDILWVGLSTPKQEHFMARHLGILDTQVMVGVGAAFDYLAGLISEPPKWVQNAGLQWTHRLLQEPTRLWRRYLVNNPLFVWQIALQMARIRRYSLREG